MTMSQALALTGDLKYVALIVHLDVGLEANPVLLQG